MRNTVVLLAQLHYYSLWELIELFGWRWRRWLGARARLLRFFCNGKELSKNMAGRMSRSMRVIACWRVLFYVRQQLTPTVIVCCRTDLIYVCCSKRLLSIVSFSRVHRYTYVPINHTPYYYYVWYDKYLPSPAITAAAHPSPLTALN